MNIGDTSNNGTVIEPLNFANSPKSEQVSCPCYSVLHDENIAVTNLPLLNPAANVEDGLNIQQSKSTVIDDLQDYTQKDWIAETDSEKQALEDSEFQKLLTLNEELQKANSDLYAQVKQLKQELAEAEKILQWQKKRSSVTESMLNQQTQELETAQEQIQSIFQQLETTVQTVKSQEMFIDTHKAQLQISQERVAQLERECTLLQTNYSEQSQQLLHSENTCRELRTRLIRQQRQTLQFKAALEKCLDTPVSHYDTLEDSAYHPYDVTGGHSRFSIKARSLFPHAQPIQPWSAETDPTHDTCSTLRQHLDNSWLDLLTVSGDAENDSTSISQQDEISSDLDHTAPQPSPQLEFSPSTGEVGEVADVSSPETSNLDRQLESLIEMFFASQPAPSTDTTDIKKINDTNTDSLDRLMWGTLESHSEENQSLTNIIEDPSVAESHLPDLKLSLGNQSTIDSPAPENNDYLSDLPIGQFTPEPLGEYYLGQKYLGQKSPSPLIYPQRPPKGRKSLASVELPNFRPKSKVQESNNQSNNY